MMTTDRKWTDADDEILRKLARAGTMAEAIAFELECSVDEIRARAAELGIGLATE